MNKLSKSILVVFILLLIVFNVSLSIDEFYHYTFSQALPFVLKSSIPLIILLLYFFIVTHQSEKLSINYAFLFISLASFIIAFTCKVLYYSIIINDNIYQFSVFLYIPAILFLVLTFLDSFQGESNHPWHFYVIIPVLLILQLCLSYGYIFFALDSLDYTNPNCYKFVKCHYFSDKEFSYLPDEIPNDATNIIFYFDAGTSFHPTRTLHLEFDSLSFSPNNSHVEYEIIIPPKK